MNTQNNMILPSYSVLMQVYDKVPAEQLMQAVESMANQSHPPKDFVIICDGVLTEEQNRTIEKITNDHADIILTVCRFDERITVGEGSN